MMAVGSAGTANAGSIDPLADLAKACRAADVWFHVDGAYGAPAAMTPGHAFLREGFALADSRSEEHTSELQSLMRISYAVFCLNKKTSTCYKTTTAITHT